MQLLEREAHLASLQQYADEARAGQGRLVLVAGEAGVGKSSLLEELENQTEAHWCWGACDGLFTPRPLSPLLDIADRLGGEVRALAATNAPREQLFSALLRHLSTSESLTVLAIEDVHWADEATLDLLRFVGRRIRDARVLILVTFRDDGLSPDDPLRIALGELSSQRTTRRISLPPLSESAVATLADEQGVEAAGLHRLTGGNPYFLTEILQSQDEGLPSSVKDAVLARVGQVSAEARHVLEIAALIGARISADLIVTIEGTTLEAIHELIACGVLVCEGDKLRFRHEIARRAVESAIPPYRAMLAHRDILEAFLKAGCENDEARLAFHAEGAADEAHVLEFAPQAGRRASALGAHRDAAAQYARAVRAGRSADEVTRAHLYDAWADELALIDRWQDSADQRERALALWRELGDDLRAGDNLRKLSRTMWRLCRGEDGARAAVAALELLEPLDPGPELAWAYANLANYRMSGGDHEESIRLARLAREIAEPLGLTDVLSDALNSEACSSQTLGRVWSPLLHRSLEVAKANGHEEQAGRAYANLYAMYSGTLRIAEGEGIYLEALAYCDERDIATFGTCLRGERTFVLDRLGRWDEADALAGELLQKVGPSPVNRLNPLLSLGRVRARRGDPSAWTYLDEAVDLAEGLREPEWIANTRLARAEAHWLDGRVNAATAELDRAQKVAYETDSVTSSAIVTWRFRITGTPPADTDGLDGLVEPYVSELAGEHERATQLWDDRGLVYEAALTMLGSDDETALRTALERLQKLGAAPVAQLVRQRMRRLGVRSVPNGVRATTLAHPAGLTRREQEVLELLCAGLTNEEIANRLFLSVRTVDHHVSAVLGKLGVATRKLAAAEAARRGLIPAAT